MEKTVRIEEAMRIETLPASVLEVFSHFFGKERLVSRVTVARAITGNTKRVLYAFGGWARLIPSGSEEGFEVMGFEFGL